MRPAAVADAFYPAAPRELERLVEASFVHDLGPGKAPDVARAGPRELRALVVPHAGLVYSGPVAAHAYSALAADGLPEALVLVGPNHAGFGLAALSTQDWETPLGPMRQHAALRAALEGSVLVPDDEAHAPEHSLEVQLPFVRWLSARAGCDVPFVPILLGLQDETTAAEVAEAVAEAVRETGLDVVLVASSDLMHAGPDYDVRPPAGQRVDAFARAQDEHALKAIEALDPDKLLDEVRRRDISMCGAGPVAAVLGAAKRLGATRAEVLAHATSYDIRPHSSCVGYAAVAVR